MKKKRFDEDLEKIAYINRKESFVVCGFVIALMFTMVLILWGVYEISWLISTEIN